MAHSTAACLASRKIAGAPGPGIALGQSSASKECLSAPDPALRPRIPPGQASDIREVDALSSDNASTLADCAAAVHPEIPWLHKLPRWRSLPYAARA